MSEVGSLQINYNSAAELAATVGLPRQLRWNTDTHRLHIMDGATPGGIPFALLSEAGGAVASVAGLTGAITAANLKTALSLAKGDVGLSAVDNTSDATKNSAAVSLTNKTINASLNTISNLVLSMFAAGVIDNDSTFAANSDTRLATQKAVNTAITALNTTINGLIAAADAMIYKGVIDCSANPNYPAADRGWTYKVSVAGKIGGASGAVVEAGDLLLCITDGTASGTQAGVGANWNITQTNIDGAVIGPASVTSGNVAIFSGSGGKVIDQITFTALKTALSLAKADVGLGNVDNTSDATKNAAAVTLTNKTLTSPVINTPTGIVKGDVGLGNVDNTSDATKNAATATLTGKTYDTSGTGNVLKFGGVDINAALASYTTTVTATGVATTAAGLAWQKTLGKIVHFEYKVTCTATETGTGALRITLPSTINRSCFIFGREETVGGFWCGILAAGSNYVDMITFPGNAYPGGNNFILTANGWYEST